VSTAPAPRRRRTRVPAAPVCRLVLAVLCVPPGLFYLGFATSTALGTTLVSAGLVLASRSFGTLARRPRIPADRAVGFAAALACVIAAHLFASLAHGPVDLQRGLLSLMPLMLLVAGGAALANRLTAVSDAQLHAGLMAAFTVLCVFAAVGTTDWGPPTLAAEPWRRPVFPFFEPSVFALGFTPVLLYAVTATRGAQRAAALAAALAFGVLITSLTLLCGLVLVALLTLRKRWLVVGGAIAVLVAGQLDLSYFTERLDPTGESNNLSNLVYLQGWQMVEEAWNRSGGLGTGMQQLGVFGTDVSAAWALRALRDGEDMNLLDGSFVFAKLGADFGLFGAAIAAALLAMAVRSALLLRRAARARRPGVAPALLIAHCSVASFPVELFIRSPGYFTGAALLLSAALWLLLFGRRRHEIATPAAGTPPHGRTTPAFESSPDHGAHL
jgi:hypothetical protein